MTPRWLSICILVVGFILAASVIFMTSGNVAAGIIVGIDFIIPCFLFRRY